MFGGVGGLHPLPTMAIPHLEEGSNGEHSKDRGRKKQLSVCWETLRQTELMMMERGEMDGRTSEGDNNPSDYV